MRAGNIFVEDLAQANLLHRVNKIRVSIYGSLALTGEGHMTPSALLLGLESADVETVDTAYVPERFTAIKDKKKLFLGQGLADGKGKEIDFDYKKDFVWEWGRKLPMHSNGMRFMVFDKEGYMLATNDLFSVGGGFVVNGNAPKRVLVRGVGPGLTGLGVAGALADPQLVVFQGSTVVAQNGDWGAGPNTAVELTAAATATGAFALTAGSKDAAILVTLAPGPDCVYVAAGID